MTELQHRKETAEKVFIEMLTGVSPDTRQALLALHELMKLELAVLMSEREMSHA
ncbi:MAG: hypothetical protein J0I12_31695 [Candidatus Eremiobacteraeota bacterium]|nr:hypothetical protein [Candidatus Eremiobacteraeota bacterium]